jgi:hypothetical protein
MDQINASRKGSWQTYFIGHISHKNCLLKHTISGKIKGGIETMGRKGRRRKQLLDDLKEKRMLETER